MSGRSTLSGRWLLRCCVVLPLGAATILASLVVAASASAALTEAGEREPLRLQVRTNPFARPVIAAPVVARRGAIVVTQPVQLMTLRGVLDAGPDSFANVDGSIVGLGERVGDLKLISVGEGEAVFQRASADSSAGSPSRGRPTMVTLTVSSSSAPGSDSAGASASGSANSNSTPDTSSAPAAAAQGLRANAASRYTQATEQ